MTSSSTTAAPAPVPAPAPCGFVLGASGEAYLRLACKSAASLRRHNPGTPIDLYSDLTPPEGLFDHVHPLPASGPRPKFHCLRENRFDRAVVIDADTIAIAPIDDVFAVLERFDLAICQEQWRNIPHARAIWREDIPAAFPQFQGGLIGIRKSERSRRLIDRWEEGYLAHGTGADQPSLRELLWHDTELRVAVLPPEYNLWDNRRIGGMDHRHGTPRILHSNLFIRPRVLESDGEELVIALGRARAERLGMLRDADHSIGGDPARGFSRARKLKYVWASLRDVPRKALALLGRRYP